MMFRIVAGGAGTIAILTGILAIRQLWNIPSPWYRRGVVFVAGLLAAVGVLVVLRVLRGRAIPSPALGAMAVMFGAVAVLSRPTTSQDRQKAH